MLTEKSKLNKDWTMFSDVELFFGTQGEFA